MTFSEGWCHLMSKSFEERIKVGDIKPGLRRVNLIVKIVNVGEPRTVTFRKDLSEHRVADALVGDKTGSVLLTLWDDNIEKFSPGEVIEIKNGYTSLFRGSLRLNIGFYGSAESVEETIEEVNEENDLSAKSYEGAGYGYYRGYRGGGR